MLLSEDGNRSSFRNVVLFIMPNNGQSPKTQKIPDMNCFIYHITLKGNYITVPSEETNDACGAVK
jgi:hypothetical protein